MKFTNKTIATTKNNSLRVILENMKPQIAKAIEMCVEQEVAQNIERRPGYQVTEFGRECIEMALLFDLYKSVVSYTRDSDEVKNFEAGISIKGNFEMSGTIVRDGEDNYFRCEAIIADGMINRRHVRYITKTSLPKDNMEEANKIKAIIKKNNKINTIQSYIDTLIGYKSDSQKSYDEGMKLSREDHKQILIEKDSWLIENYGNFTKEELVQRGWEKRETYTKWCNEANEDQIDRRVSHIKSALSRVSRLEKSIAKEEIKLAKAKAL